ncbi:MAG: sulfotransferase [Deltaproteobacteria bacterium]|nr:sulfotransferase [Deltaproteobacteria bacterium]
MADLLLRHPDFTRPVGHFESPILVESRRYMEYVRRSVIPRGRGLSADELAPMFGRSLQDYYRSKCPAKEASRRYLVHKYPSARGINNFPAMFPDGRLLLLVRDGRDSANSVLSAARFIRRSDPRRVYLLTHVAQRWRESAEAILDFQSKFPGRSLLVRFEALHTDPVMTLRNIGDFLQLEDDANLRCWLEGARDAPVRGSSFLRDTADGTREVAGGTNWRPTPRSASFNPIGRWRSGLSWFESRLFEAVTHEQLRRLGYD